ncbi:hypothetical protein E3N88_06366 [Mikania micrantha]|uniref:WRKY domain-containing protein n=1 Tax=Mikania micrantha TaxID=192012 RepID=A0A5N6PQW8_9ASTR|nr:hypothetical protein E3N88_06366 [Mikania micrantha]
MNRIFEDRLFSDVMCLNNHKTLDLQFSPFLAKLFLQENNSLTRLPSSFFQHMPVLLVLDLSHTNIQSLPPSISKLCSLEEFILQDCSLLIELPSEIGALKNLKLFDLEGTEIMYLPKEIGKLGSLEHLRVSFSVHADDYKERNGIQQIIPRTTILKLAKLKELSISVSPEAEWWEGELLEAIMGDLLFLPDLKTLNLYLPTSKALQQFLRLERYKVPIYSSLWNYRFMTGRCEELPFSVQLDIEKNFLKLEKCVKYMNGEGYADEIVELISDARALYLRRHWTIEKLSMFDIRKLKYCLLMECNEMLTLVDQEDFCKHKNKSTSHSKEDEILGSLQYLSIHFLKKLQRISKGPIGGNSLSCLRILALHACPELTSIFTECLLDNLQSLTEIIVEDCPKVNCLVKLEEGTRWRCGPFLPNLRRVSLLDLPELVSVSGGVCIAPQLDTLLVFNCMKLDYLSVMEIPRDTMAIEGEIEWWDALKYGKLTWESVFVQLKRDGNQVNQNLSRYAAKDSELVDHLQVDHYADLSNEAQKISNRVPSDDIDILRKHLQNKSLNSSFPRKHTVSVVMSRHKVKVSKSIDAEEAPDDGYIWRKYGQKDIFGAKYPRAYYRCSFRYTYRCYARKTVHRSTEDPCAFEVVYMGKHTCPAVLRSSLHVNQNLPNDIKEDGEHVDRLQIVHTVELSNVTQKMSKQKIVNCNNGTAFRMWEPPALLSGKSDNTDIDCMLKAPNHELASTKKKSRSGDIAKWIHLVKENSNEARKHLQNESYNPKYPSASRHQVKVNNGIEVEKALDDGYRWQKYGEKATLGSKYKRAYYKCSGTYGCSATKCVQKSSVDSSVFEVSYKAKHTCSTFSSSNFSSTATKSACTTLTPRVLSTATESASLFTESHFDIAKKPQVLHSNKLKSISSRDAKWTQQLKASPNTIFDVPPDDGYIWRKYGQHDILGATYPMLSYRCNSCDTKKLVQRSDDDPSIWIVTYEGIHTCLSLSVSNSTCESKSAFSILESGDSSTTIESGFRILENSGSSMTAESTSTFVDNSFGLNFTKKMSGNASIQRWKQQAEEIQSPSLEFQLPSFYEPNVGKKKLGDINTELQQIDTASVVAKNSASSTTTEPEATQNSGLTKTESTSTITDNSSGQNLTKKMSGSASNQRWKQQTIISEVEDNGRWNFSSFAKAPPNAKGCPPPVLKARKEKLGDKIAELQQLISPGGKFAVMQLWYVTETNSGVGAMVMVNARWRRKMKMVMNHDSGVSSGVGGLVDGGNWVPHLGFLVVVES